MHISKKFLLVGLLVAAVLGGTLGGIAIAQDNGQGTATVQTDNNTRLSNLLDKVVEIYKQNTGVTIDTEELLNAFKQAGQETCNTAIDNYLDKMVENGKITQAQADEFKAWLDARPDVPITPGTGLQFHGKIKMNGMFGLRGALNGALNTD
ncbi:MAG: hypothetical protein WC370_05470 [Dehalococcoidales bacterium]